METQTVVTKFFGKLRVYIDPQRRYSIRWTGIEMVLEQAEEMRKLLKCIIESKPTDIKYTKTAQQKTRQTEEKDGETKDAIYSC